MPDASSVASILVNATGSEVNQPRSGFAGGRHVADLESPLPDIRLAGGCDGVFHALVDHDPFHGGPSQRTIRCPSDQSL